MVRVGIFLMFLSAALADIDTSQKQGEMLAKSAQAASQSVPITGQTLTQMGVGVTKSPPQSALSADTLPQATQEKASQDETLDLLNKSQQDRPLYKVEVDEAALSDTLSSPEKAFEATTETTFQEKGVQRVCHTSGPSYTQTCKRQRMVSITVVPAKYVTHWTCYGHWKNKVLGTKRYCEGCISSQRLIAPKQVTITRDEWVGCEDLDRLHEQGLADVESETLGPKDQVCLIDGEPIVRDYWETTRHYRCGPKMSSDECESLKILGCRALEAVCIEETKDDQGRRVCLKYRHTYDCPAKKGDRTRVSGGQTPYCLNGDCFKSSYLPNENMVEALSRLEILQQMQGSQSGLPLKIFSGTSRRCTTNFGGSFKDCCKSQGGIGVSLKLATQCSAEEEALMKARQQGLCVFVGARQKNKALGMNLSREYSFCCYPTKLARLFQEQARRQLGISWGTAKHPNCRGLTPEELQRVDFSQLDLKEVFSETAASAQKTAQRLHMSMEQKKEALSSQKSLKTLEKKQQGETHDDVVY